MSALHLPPKQQFEHEKRFVIDIINNSQMGAVQWIEYIESVKELLKKSYEDELMTGKKQQIKL